MTESCSFVAQIIFLHTEKHWTISLNYIPWNTKENIWPFKFFSFMNLFSETVSKGSKLEHNTRSSYWVQLKQNQHGKESSLLPQLHSTSAGQDIQLCKILKGKALWYQIPPLQLSGALRAGKWSGLKLKPLLHISKHSRWVLSSFNKWMIGDRLDRQTDDRETDRQMIYHIHTQTYDGWIIDDKNR